MLCFCASLLSLNPFDFISFLKLSSQIYWLKRFGELNWILNLRRINSRYEFSALSICTPYKIYPIPNTNKLKSLLRRLFLKGCENRIYFKSVRYRIWRRLFYLELVNPIETFKHFIKIWNFYPHGICKIVKQLVRFVLMNFVGSLITVKWGE